MISITTAQATVANLTVMWMSAAILAVCCWLAAFDMVRAGAWLAATTRAGVAVYLSAAAAEYAYWWLRWLLRASGNIDASHWFVVHAHWTIGLGMISTAGVFLTLTSILWPQFGRLGLVLVGLNA